MHLFRLCRQGSITILHPGARRECIVKSKGRGTLVFENTGMVKNRALEVDLYDACVCG